MGIRIANSEGPDLRIVNSEGFDQIAPFGAVWSGSSLLPRLFIFLFIV